MKHAVFVPLLFALVTTPAFGEALPDQLTAWLGAQLWERDSDRPILSLGEQGRFDDTHIFAPVVIREKDRYLMWYCGSRGAVKERIFRLGLAVSENGLNFTKHKNNPVFGFADGRHSVLTPTILRRPDGSVLREDGQLRMWFSSTVFREKSELQPPFVNKYFAINTARWRPSIGLETSQNVSAVKERKAGRPCITQPPNILLITCDNLGYGDLPCYNPKTTIRAPHLDRLASQGARLTSFYTASPTCTVSRACLLTGRISQRHGLDYQLPGVQGNYGVGLNHQEKLLPQFLKQAPTPYVTGCFGKWNIGFAQGSRPTERGFDEFIGHASGNIDYYHHNYRERHDLYEGLKELHRDGDYATDIFADAAIDFIRRHSASDRAWFCYLPFNAPHFPTAGNKRKGQPNIWQAPDDAFDAIGLSPEETDPRKRYDAVVFALDRSIGRVLAALDAAGCTDNTFVFFMSDNGAFRLNRAGLDVGINDPLRNGGVTCWEGGVRVAAIARWPDRIKAGSVIAEPSWSPDILVACAQMSGATLPKSIALDGKNPLPMLTKGASSPHESLYFEYRQHAALRKGDWKIVREHPDRAWQLFHLKDDQQESRDLAKDHPDKVNELQNTFLAWKILTSVGR